MTRTEIPDDLAELLHTAADAVPAHAGDLAAVRARGRTRRRRRTAATAGAAALAVAAAVGVPFAFGGLGGAATAPVTDPPRLDALPPFAEPAAPAEPAQRLLLDGAGWVAIEGGHGEEPDPPVGAHETYEWYQQQPGAYGVLGTLAEVRPDGEVVELDLGSAGVDGYNQVVAAPDGRLAAIGLVDLMPGVPRQDGPCVEGLELRLLIIEPDGSVSLSREVRVKCETVTLLGADAEHAYLLRDESRLVAHDLATGAEQVLADAPELLGPAPVRLDFERGRVARVDSDPADTACVAGGPAVRMSVTVAEVATGVTTTHPLPGEGCSEWAGRIRLSPDGRHAAVGYDRLSGDPADPDGSDGAQPAQLRVAVIELDTGAVVADRLVAELERSADQPEQAAIAGMAWDDDQTLRVAWYRLPVSGEGVHWLADLVEVEKVSIG